MSTDALSPTTTTATTTTTTIVPTRRSYRCYHCNYSFHISSSTSSHITTSSFRCPSCHHRHLLPHHTISPSPPPPPPPPPSFNVIHIPSGTDISSDSDISSDEDDSFLEFTTVHHPKLTPASKSFVDSLPTIKLDPAVSSQCCPICMDDLGVHSDANKLPCQHVFHKDCILQWLNGTNTCPLCRYKLPQEPSPSPGPCPSPSPSSEVEERRELENNYYEVVRPRPGVISRVSVRRSTGTGSVSGRWAAREFWVEGQSSDAPPRDADGDTLMVDA